MPEFDCNFAVRSASAAGMAGAPARRAHRFRALADPPLASSSTGALAHQPGDGL